jgi:hypothetical protein
MLTFSILWVMFAATVTAMALLKRSSAGHAGGPESQESGSALAFFAVLSTLLLLAGFVYVGSSLVRNL